MESNLAESFASAVVPADPDFEARVRASFAQQGLLVGLGARLAAIAPGSVTIELDFSERVGQQIGLFHGGAIGAIADSAGGYSALTLMPAGSEVVTVEYKINFTRPAHGRLIRAVGHVLRAGKSITTARVDVNVVEQGTVGAGQERLCAAMQATFMRTSQ